jgi:hypothetical protein
MAHFVTLYEAKTGLHPRDCRCRDKRVPERGADVGGLETLQGQQR